MNCPDVQKFIHAFMDGEFDEQEQVLVRAHLNTCQQCRAMAQFEEKLRERLRQGEPEVVAPPQLRARIRRALDEAEPQGVWAETGDGWAQRWLWKLIPAGVAAALLAGVVVSGRVEQSNEDAVVRESLAWHRQTVPMDVAGPGLEQVRRFLSDKVEFAVRPPVFKEPSTRLVGARLSNLGAHRAAYLRYQVGPQRVSVFIFDPTTVNLHGHAVRMGDRQGYMVTRGGYNVVMYTVGGTGYVVASDMERSRLIQLVSGSR